MKEWSKKQKIVVTTIFIAVLAVVGVVAAALNYRVTQEGMKRFQVEVESQRDDYLKETQCESDKEYLGEFLRTMEGCEWVDGDYGIYINGFDGKKEDLDNQYWWCVYVNGESATTGADEIPLQDGDTYRFVLMQGW